MIYEFIQMAENDIAAEAYKFKFLVVADIKNCYPSIYTHSLSWALHGTSYMKPQSRWRDFHLVGNRLDRLFQRSNRNRTNGLPIGPGISDVASELLLARVDAQLSASLNRNRFVAVRFKDDYRILCKSEEDAAGITKCLQIALHAFGLALNEEKTKCHKLPDGLFRPWVSRYHAANPRPKDWYTYKQLREVYLSVLAIERELPGTGVVDRFLADIVTDDYQPNFDVSRGTVSQILSILLMLASIRIKSFPKTLGVIEAILRSMDNAWYTDRIGSHLAGYMSTLARDEAQNRYLILWILYFLRSNNLERLLRRAVPFRDPLLRSVQTSRSNVFAGCREFKLLVAVSQASKAGPLLQHLDVFLPQ